MDGEKKPWEQQPNEPDAAFARFKIYLMLGRARSIRAAYESTLGSTGTKRGKKVRHSGQWDTDSVTYNWVERALAYDIDALTGKGYDTVIDFVNTLAILANKALKTAAQENVKPRGLSGVLELVTLLGSFIPSETVAAVRADAEQRRISRLGRSDTASPDNSRSSGEPGGNETSAG